MKPPPPDSTLLFNTTYRSDIDGLRAIAISMVVAYHTFPEFIGGGFVGVDIFFVISGYLISSIIFNDLSNGIFSFRHFYARRIKRIFPALILVLAASFAIGWLTLLPLEFEQLGIHIISGAAFASNFILWSDAGYFDTAAELKPLLHLWSLSIEEQFYLIWPLAIYFAWKNPARLVAFLVGIILGSFLICIVLTYKAPVPAFFLLPARLWELGLGGALAYGMANRRYYPLSKFVRNILSIVGLFLIAVAVYLLDKNSLFPGWWAAAPTLGCCFIILAGSDSWLNTRVFSNRILVHIGLFSYPLYLWHWPLLSFSRIIESGNPTIASRILVIGLSFLLAFLTYQYLEKPSKKIRVYSIYFGGIIFLMLALATVGYQTFNHNGYPARIDDAARRYATYSPDIKTDARANACWLTESQSATAYANSCVDAPIIGKERQQLILLWGDSHAARLFPGLSLVNKDSARLAQFTRDGCPPIFHYGVDTCINANAHVLAQVKTLRPDVVILFARWDFYSRVKNVDLLELNKTVERLTDVGVPKIIIVGPAPAWKNSLPHTITRLYKIFRMFPDRTKIGLEEGISELDGKIKGQLRTFKTARYFSALEAMCNEDGCLTQVGTNPQELTTWDYGHLTTPAAEYLSNKLASATELFSNN
ncbi:MAG: acyltransferase [Glaciimonas sp.]|nr:acyltransferase [Glaciimonas sp.]